MKKIKKLPLMLMLTLLFSALSPCALADSEELSPPELQSAAAIVIDMDTGRSLYDYNADEQRAPASLTKIMTVLLAVEAVDRGEASLDDSVTAGDEALDGMVEDGSTESIQVGETMSLRDLLYCAMLSSANEACNIIAVHISGSIDAFVSEMNARAAELGCTGTHFANTHGLSDSDHYTTARDLAVISREAMNNETFYELSGTTGYTVPATNMSEERRLNNTNGLINPESTAYPGNYYEYARAGKTGHTDEAGFCLASMAERDGVKLVAVVLGGQRLDDGAGGSTYTNFSDTRTLYNWVYNNFAMQEILSSTEIVSSVDVSLAANGGQAMLRPEESVSALVPKTGFSASSLEREITVYNELNGEALTAPIASGITLGEITISLDGVTIGSAKLVTSDTVELARSEFMKQEISGFFGNIWVIVIIVVLIAALAAYIWSVVRYRKLHKLHLQSLAEAKENYERSRKEEDENYFAPAQTGVEERTTVLSSTPVRGAPIHTGELEKTTVLTGVGRSASKGTPAGKAVRRSGGQARPAAPQRQSPARPQQPPQSGSAAPRAPGSTPPAGDKARRDYFEEFFRNNGNNSNNGSKNKSE